MSKILIFDSGVGGLSVYQAIKEQLPAEDYLYLYDNANFPYGELEDHFLIERVCQLIHHMYHEFQPDIVVIACNSASTLVLPELRKRFPIPFVGVVPAIKPAALRSKKKKIGLLATPGTVVRDYTDLLIHEYASDCSVDMIGTTTLVEQAERKLNGEMVQLDAVFDVVARWQDEHQSPDIVVLGCTHFPLLREELQGLIGDHVEFIDSGRAIAKRVKTLLPEAERREYINGRVFCTKGEDKKKLTQLFNEIGLSQPVLINI